MRGMRVCAKSHCDRPAAATMVLRYEARSVLLTDLLDRHDRNLAELCGPHADTLRPPIGWQIVDERRPVAAWAAPPAVLS
jgi:hypothetical protein